MEHNGQTNKIYLPLHIKVLTSITVCISNIKGIYLTMHLHVYLTLKLTYFADTKGTSVAIVSSSESSDIIIIASSSLQVRVYDNSRLYPTYK